MPTNRGNSCGWSWIFCSRDGDALWLGNNRRKRGRLFANQCRQHGIALSDCQGQCLLKMLSGLLRPVLVGQRNCQAIVRLGEIGLGVQRLLVERNGLIPMLVRRQGDPGNVLGV